MEVKVDSNLIRPERDNRGWTQDDPARLAGLRLLNTLRTEKPGPPSPESVAALASLLSVEVANLRVNQTEPSRGRAIRLSLELPMRLALAVVSGVLCALHFRWNILDSGWLVLGFGELDFGIAGALFGV